MLPAKIRAAHAASRSLPPPLRAMAECLCGAGRKNGSADGRQKIVRRTTCRQIGYSDLEAPTSPRTRGKSKQRLNAALGALCPGQRRPLFIFSANSITRPPGQKGAGSAPKYGRRV